MEKDSKIYVAGHEGMVGSALVRNIKKNNYSNIINRTRTELDLMNQEKTKKFFFMEKPDTIFHLAALARIQPSIKNPTITIQNNFDSTLNILEWGREKKCLFFKI